MNRLSIRASALVCVVLSGGLLASCASDPRSGYAFADSYDTAIRTISVPIFRNETFARGIETRLTDAITKQLQRHTPYRVVASEQADTTLSGTITEVDLRRLSDDPQTGLVQEQTYQITVRFTWMDNRTGQPRVSRERFSSTGVFTPAIEAGERLEVGQRDAIDELARDIVETLRSTW